MKDGQTVAGVAVTVVMLAASLLANPSLTDPTTTFILPGLMMLLLTGWFWLVLAHLRQAASHLESYGCGGVGAAPVWGSTASRWREEGR